MSGAGTPLIHTFLTEPAFLGRDFFLTYTEAGRESALEAEVELALTRRIGLVAESAWVDSETSSGASDSFLAVRGLLVEEARLQLSVTGEARLPTGSAAKETGTGEWGWAALTNGWLDLGGWVTLQANAGIERIPALGETAFVWSAALTKSFEIPMLLEGGRPRHGIVPVLSLLAEVAGETALSSGLGPTEGLRLLGVSATISPHIELRGAYHVSFDGDEDGWSFGLIWHF